MNAALLQFEAEVRLGPTRAARLLGVAYPTYAQYRSGRRAFPTYHEHHVQALLLLAPEHLAALIKEHVHGGA